MRAIPALALAAVCLLADAPRVLAIPCLSGFGYGPDGSKTGEQHSRFVILP